MFKRVLVLFVILFALLGLVALVNIPAIEAQGGFGTRVVGTSAFSTNAVTVKPPMIPAGYGTTENLGESFPVTVLWPSQSPRLYDVRVAQVLTEAPSDSTEEPEQPESTLEPGGVVVEVVPLGTDEPGSNGGVSIEINPAPPVPSDGTTDPGKVAALETENNILKAILAALTAGVVGLGVWVNNLRQNAGIVRLLESLYGVSPETIRTLILQVKATADQMSGLIGDISDGVPAQVNRDIAAQVARNRATAQGATKPPVEPGG